MIAACASSAHLYAAPNCAEAGKAEVTDMSEAVYQDIQAAMDLLSKLKS